MKARDAFLFGLFGILALIAAALGTRVSRQLERGGWGRVEVGAQKVSTLNPATREKLAGLSEQVLVTYAVSPPERMPSDRKDLERRVVDLLEAMRRAAPEKFDYLIIDPDSNPELVNFASRRRFSPQRVRTVLGDAWSEREIWSSLSVAYGARPEAVLHGIGPEHLPRLQDTILAQLDAMESPRRARIALAAPRGFENLAGLLSERGELERVDLDRDPSQGGDPWPEEADLLFWIQPANTGPARLAELERFLKRGRSVVVAGGLLRAEADALQDIDGAPALLLHPSPAKMEPLLAQLGLEAVRGLVLDSRSDALVFGEETLPAPFLLRCIAPNQDFSAWRRLPNGTLLFTAPSPLAIDEDIQRDRRTTARVLATSSDGTWIQAPPLAPGLAVLLSDLDPSQGLQVAKQALAIELVPDDPWRGNCLVLAGTTPLEDGMLGREGVAHANLVRAILDQYTAPERLVIATAARTEKSPIPALSSGARKGWRVFVVGLPLGGLALLIAWALMRLRLDKRSATAQSSDSGTLLLRGVLLALLIGFAAPLVSSLFRSPNTGFDLDLTEEGLHGLTSGSRAIAQRAQDLGSVQAELLVSASNQLPPELLPRLGRLRETLQAFRRAGVPFAITEEQPEDLDQERYDSLVQEGLLRQRTTDKGDEQVTLRSFHAALRLQRGDEVQLLSFDDPIAFEELEFRVAFALWRMETGRRPRLGLASDVPRPSAAEAYENFQSKGLFAPTGVDVYAAARARLEGLDLDVVHINPRKPELPDDLDALLWLQPRRSISPMLKEATRYLVAGGNLMIAAQHFHVQARQYRGAGFEGVLWPQPQSPDLENLWLPELGIQMVREVLFDARHITLKVDSQVVGRRAGRVFERQQMALPFLIRADASGFRDHPITRQLGDQALLYASEIRLDEDRLKELGLRAQTLIHSSKQTWSYAWKGGWIPTEFLSGPAPQLEGGSELLGPKPLMVLVEGTFPVPSGYLSLNPPLDEATGEPLPPPPRTDWPNPNPGRLLLLSSAEVFSDARLLDPKYRGDQLLVNSALFLALPPELASIAQRRDVARGFGQVEEADRSRWRVLTLGAGPLLISLLTLLWGLFRRPLEVPL